MRFKKLLYAVPCALALPLAAHALHEVDALELDVPSPLPGQKVLASGTCHKPDASVNFTFTQNGETRSFGVKPEVEDGEFAATLDLAKVNARKGLAWLRAECSDGKTLATWVALSPTIHSAAISRRQAREGGKLVESLDSSGVGYSSGYLKIENEEDLQVGGDISARGTCFSDEGIVKFHIVQEGQDQQLSALAFGSTISFATVLDLPADKVKPGNAHLVAICPAGLVLTNHVEIAGADAAPDDE